MNLPPPKKNKPPGGKVVNKSPKPKFKKPEPQTDVTDLNKQAEELERDVKKSTAYIKRMIQLQKSVKESKARMKDLERAFYGLIMNALQPHSPESIEIKKKTLEFDLKAHEFYILEGSEKKG